MAAPAARFPDRASAAHPIHSILAAYPLVCFTGALVTDIAYANSANMQWANFSVWLIAVGVMFGVLAAVAGIVNALGRRERGPRRPVWHSVATAAMLALAVVNGLVHSRDGWTSVVPTGLALSVVVSILAVATAWSGYAPEGDAA